MRTETLVTQEVTAKKVTIVCDYCGSSKGGCRGMQTCSVCKKDICQDHLTWWNSDPFIGGDNGDYPPKVCKECDEAVRDVRAECSKISDECYSRIEQIEKAWRESRTS